MSRTKGYKYLCKYGFTAEILQRYYVDMLMPADAIGDIFGCTSGPVLRALRKFEIPVRHHNDTKRGSKASNRMDLPDAEIIEMYMQDYQSAQTVAAHFGISRGPIDRILKENGIKKKPNGKARNYFGKNSPNYNPSITDKEREQRRDMNAQAEWRDKIYELDGHRCVKCNRNGKLNAHHIFSHSKYTEKRWDTDNGATLCVYCHREFHSLYGIKRFTDQDFRDFIKP